MTKKKAPVAKVAATPIEFGWTPIAQYDHANFTDGSLTTRSPLLLLTSKSAGTVFGYVEQYKMDVNHPVIGSKKKGDIIISTVNNVVLKDVTAYSALPDPYKEEKQPAGV